MRWAWSTRHTYRERVPRADAEHENLVVVRLRSQREVDTWLSSRLALPQLAADSPSTG